jgi:hypothetical protein
MVSVNKESVVYSTETTGHHAARVPVADILDANGEILVSCPASSCPLHPRIRPTTPIATGAGEASLSLRLHCFSSCAGSIARRNLQLLFTLENRCCAGPCPGSGPKP